MLDVFKQLLSENLRLRDGIVFFGFQVNQVPSIDLILFSTCNENLTPTVALCFIISCEELEISLPEVS